ncbi:MAG: CRISPR-associated endonuclease Cas2 [Bacteroidetes bacterium CG_4_9_14_3_um_filter_41_19]|nr:MAG: CRISPR-associated endonuclease Cas2 [Bacteroidetes bacterium CG_4_9_14_3_um_filter_41_19]
MLLFHKAGFSHSGASYTQTKNIEDELLELPERIQKILQIVNRTHLTANQMLYFIMYDIENNKVRTAISKYLEKNGCLRVQKSIFFVETERKVYNQIHSDLKHIQELYDNHDSIFLVPVSTDQVRSMKIIGQSIDFDLIIGSKNTLFF